MLNDNGTVATYIQDGDVEDSDEVKGRESLSETFGAGGWILLSKKMMKSFFKRIRTAADLFFRRGWVCSLESTGEREQDGNNKCAGR